MKILLFTDLDATLLDKDTYSCKHAEKGIEELRRRDAALVMVTSKTLSEVTSFHHELGFDDPFVFENGGGIAFRRERPPREILTSWESMVGEFESEGFTVLALGAKYDMLVKSLVEISGEVRTTLIGFFSMSDEEVAAATGLPVEQAAKARMRLFDEPFMIAEESKSAVAEIVRAARRRGLEIVKGGRFWHLIGHTGKGKAVSLLLEAYRKRYGEVVSIGLGDSPNDFPFLQLLDIPIILGKASKAEPVSFLPERAHQYDVLGPEGWNQAVLDILATL
jgi:mannosyl-3-phosphoglycerate phosphatase